MSVLIYPRHGQALDIRYQMSGIRCQVSGIRYQVSGIRYQVPGTRNQVSGTRYPGIQVSRTHQLWQYMIVIRLSPPRQHFWVRQVHHCLFSIVVCASLDSSSIPNPPMQASRSRDTECHAAPYRGAFWGQLLGKREPPIKGTTSCVKSVLTQVVVPLIKNSFSDQGYDPLC